MISYISNSIAGLLLKKNIINEERLPVCQYGFEIMVSTVLGFLLVILCGVVLGMLPHAVLFYAMFVAVRMPTGGYHAQTHLKCKMTLVSCSLFVLIISKFFELSFAVQAAMLVFYLAAVLIFAPVEHVNVPLTDEDKVKNRIIAIITAFILTGVNIAGFRWFREISRTAVLTLFIIAVLMIIPQFQKKNHNSQEQQ